MSRGNRRVRRTRRGDFEVQLPEEERALLRSVSLQVRAVLLEPDTAAAPWLARLFPVAYPEDEEREREYRQLMHDELRNRHMEAIETLEATLGAERLSEAQMLGWLAALNDVRLVLGTRLDVSEETTEDDYEEDDPDHGLFGVYTYLGWLQEQVVTAVDPEA